MWIALGAKKKSQNILSQENLTIWLFMQEQTVNNRVWGYSSLLDFQWMDRNISGFIENILIVFQVWINVLWVWDDLSCE